MSRAPRPLLALLCALGLLGGCEREQRRFDPVGSTPITPESRPVEKAEPMKRSAGPAAFARSPVEENAYAVAQGKRLYRWYNCSGCHAGGGGGMGPALMDDQWRYGHEAADIVASIADGRPNGMPSFRNRIPEDQMWQLAAYVRSMSGQLRQDVAPGRGDTLSSGEPEAMRDKLQPRPEQQAK